jgi:hypothetical protein
MGDTREREKKLVNNYSFQPLESDEKDKRCPTQRRLLPFGCMHER